jgi:diacylglycerol diphosphate phosphatase / phosphatidate phosphatase
MYNRKICTGDKDEIDDSLESFPSGHTTAAFGGFIFLYLYLNAKLKVWSNYHPAYWKLIVTYMPVLGATLIGGALTIDEYHNWYDVFAGAVIGTVMALSSYRMVYASIWDFRFNHIPLVRDMPFMYNAGSAAFMEFHDAMWTRKAGWGSSDRPTTAGEGLPTNGRRSNDGYQGRPSISRKPVAASPRSGRADEMV